MVDRWLNLCPAISEAVNLVKDKKIKKKKEKKSS